MPAGACGPPSDRVTGTPVTSLSTQSIRPHAKLNVSTVAVPLANRPLSDWTRAFQLWLAPSQTGAPKNRSKYPVILTRFQICTMSPSTSTKSALLHEYVPPTCAVPSSNALPVGLTVTDRSGG